MCNHFTAARCGKCVMCTPCYGCDMYNHFTAAVCDLHTMLRLQYVRELVQRCRVSWMLNLELNLVVDGVGGVMWYG